MPDLIVQRHADGGGAAELRNYNFHKLATAPNTNLVAGRYFYNTATNKFGYYNGSSWIYPEVGTVTSVSMTQPAAGLTVTGGPVTTAGGFTLALANDLAALEGLGSTGIPVRTAADTWVQRSIVGTANQVTVTNGDGVAGNMTLSLPQNIHSAATPTFGNVTISAMGTNATDAATKGYVDNLVQGVKWKKSVRMASTGNVALTGTQTIDGVVGVATDRVLLKAQTTPAENGIWVMAAGAWARATDADAWTELVSATVAVEEGTLNADTNWTCTVNAGGTLGSSAITFAQLAGGAGVTGGNGLTLTGNDLSVNVDGTTIEISGDALRVKDAGLTDAKIAAANKDGVAGTASMRTLGTGAQQAAAGNHAHTGVYAPVSVPVAFGNGALTSFTLTHNLNTLNVSSTFRLTNTPYTPVDCDWVPADVNSITVTTLSAPTANQYTAIIQA